jgi:hypothetical protein
MATASWSFNPQGFTNWQQEWAIHGTTASSSVWTFLDDITIWQGTYGIPPTLVAGAITENQASQTDAITAGETFTAVLAESQHAQVDAITVRETFTAAISETQSAQSDVIFAMVPIGVYWQLWQEDLNPWQAMTALPSAGAAGRDSWSRRRRRELLASRGRGV